MDPYMKGMAGFLWATIILYFISKKKGGRWTTAFRIVGEKWGTHPVFLNRTSDLGR